MSDKAPMADERRSVPGKTTSWWGGEEGVDTIWNANGLWVGIDMKRCRKNRPPKDTSEGLHLQFHWLF